jgi:hypothetical protein
MAAHQNYAQEFVDNWDKSAVDNWSVTKKLVGRKSKKEAAGPFPRYQHQT